jgi:DNA-directed RNA polymerase subunit L
MAKEKISRKEYDVMRSYLSKKKNAKVNLDDYEVDEPVSHHSNDNEDMKRTLKRKQNMKNTIRLTESDLKRVISESVKRILRENDDFQPHGYRGTSNWGGLEMQISDSGDAARLRNSVTNQVSDWLEIQFDEDGVAYVIDENGDEERLCDYMRY